MDVQLTRPDTFTTPSQSFLLRPPFFCPARLHSSTARQTKLKPAPIPNSAGPNKISSQDRVSSPDLQPPSIAPYTTAHVHEGGSHLSFLQGGGHSGSHPHLVNEFVSSIVEGRKPTIDAVVAARWTAPGIATHMSAMKEGEGVEVPGY